MTDRRGRCVGRNTENNIKEKGNSPEKKKKKKEIFRVLF